MKILIGCPTSDYKRYCLNEYAAGLKSLTHPHDILLADNSETEQYAKEIAAAGIPVIKDQFYPSARKRIVESRNILRKRVLDEGYDCFLSLEQDIIPPPDVIERLLAHRKDIVSGIYYIDQFMADEAGNRRQLFFPVLYTWTERSPEGKDLDYEHMKYLLPEEVEQPRLIEVKAAGVGCLLIRRKVLEKVQFRYEKQSSGFDDVFFCRDAISSGFRIYADTGVKCRHLIKGKDWSWSRMQL